MSEDSKDQKVVTLSDRFPQIPTEPPRHAPVKPPKPEAVEEIDIATEES